MSNIDLVKKLMKAVEGTDITEIEYEEEGVKVRLCRGIPGSASARPVYFENLAPAATVGSVDTKAVAAGGPSHAIEKDNGNYIPVTSPFVGTFYRSPAPGANLFVQEGKEVQPGDVLCIIEAMKLMNEIESEKHGRVARILVENGSPVEFGQELFLLEPLS